MQLQGDESMIGTEGRHWVGRRKGISRVYGLRPTVQRGYTLIEVLISVGILIILFFGGYGAYRQFAKRQALSNAYKETRTDLNLARERASSGEKPSGCVGTLRGYKVSFSPTQYTVATVCDTDVAIRTNTLPSGVEFQQYVNAVTYKVLGQGTDLSAGQTMVLTNFTQTITFTITKEGLVQQ